MKICHLTSVHSRSDTRIFLKELPSIAASGFETVVVVADGKGSTNNGTFTVFDIGRVENRFYRILKQPFSIYRAAIKQNADLYHFHDPELLIVGLLLKNREKKVVYDIHEDVPRDILSKDWIWKPIRKVIACLVEVLENFVCKRLTGLIVVTETIRARFYPINKNVELVNNYPWKDELFSQEEIPFVDKKRQVCYVGGLTAVRGIEMLVDAMEFVDGRLILAGEFDDEDFHNRLSKKQGWRNVDFIGFVDRQKMSAILRESVAGLVTFLPEPNHVSAQPNKFFEYMSAGVPVIASNFPLWIEIVEQGNVGICVDPTNPKEIANAINKLLDDPTLASSYGLNGRQAIISKYCWEQEKEKLTSFYKII